MLFQTVLLLVGLFAGGLAAVTGFGIGSLLTPVFSFRLSMKVAVVAAAFPHIAACGYRLWTLRHRIDRGLLIRFGLPSAVGGLIGACLHSSMSDRLLGHVFAVLLIGAGVLAFTGLSERVRLGRNAAYLAGLISGFLGGLVGNQGGIRGAALLAFDAAPATFVATMTGVALLVDAVRIPIYLWTDGQLLRWTWWWIVLASIGALAGTVAGRRVLTGMAEKTFQKVIAVMISLIGVYMLYSSGSAGMKPWPQAGAGGLNSPGSSLTIPCAPAESGLPGVGRERP